MSANLMIHDSLNCLFSVVNGKSNHNFTIALLIVVYHRCRCDGILSELVRKKIIYLQAFYVKVECFRGLFQSKRIWWCQKFMHLNFLWFFKNLQGQGKITLVWRVILFHILVLLIIQVGYIRVKKKGIIVTITLEENLFLFLQVQWFQLL